MKKFLFQIILMSICTVAIAETINLHWLNDNGTTYTESTCTVDDDLIIPTTPPTKYGYTFTGWEMNPFVQIEYLESTGKAFINTNFIPLTTNNLTINISFEFSSIFSNAVNGIWGYMNTSTMPRFGFYYNSDIGFRAFGSGVNDTIYWGKSASTGVQYTAQLHNGIFTLTDNNGSLQINIGKGNTGQNMYPIYLGARCNENAVPVWPSNIKIYYFQIYDNDTLVRNMIPVLDGNGVPCMYDKVEGKFYYNAGTGQFIAGPVIGE